MTTSTKVRTRVLGLMAFGLLATTALTANFLVTPSLPVHAETAQQVAPQAGFADLAARVMPAVVSVEVNFANVADNADDNDDEGSEPVAAEPAAGQSVP